LLVAFLLVRGKGADGFVSEPEHLQVLLQRVNEIQMGLLQLCSNLPNKVGTYRRR
jgi:hypothetical protein